MDPPGWGQSDSAGSQFKSVAVYQAEATFGWPSSFSWVHFLAGFHSETLIEPM